MLAEPLGHEQREFLDFSLHHRVWVSLPAAPVAGDTSWSAAREQDGRVHRPRWLQNRLSSAHRVQELPSHGGLLQTPEPELDAAVVDHRGCSRFCSSSCVLRVSRQFLDSGVRLFRRGVPCAIPCGQSTTEAWGYSASAVQSSRSHVSGVPLGWFLKGRPSLVLHAVRCPSSKHFLETSPLRNGRRFWQSVARLDQARRRHGFVLHAVTRLLRPRLSHYYGIICHLTPRRLLLELPLEAALPASHASPMGELTRPG